MARAVTPLRPPFRAEHIGSLLRPAGLLDARRQYERREISGEQLRASEDQAIAAAVDLQARVGLGLATDGEFRRRSYHSYFYRSLGDVTPDAVGGEAGGSLVRGAQPLRKFEKVVARALDEIK